MHGFGNEMTVFLIFYDGAKEKQESWNNGIWEGRFHTSEDVLWESDLKEKRDEDSS